MALNEDNNSKKGQIILQGTKRLLLLPTQNGIITEEGIPGG
jgi:hypothetical protein